MIENKKLIDMTKSTLGSASAITLSVEESDKFLDYLIDQSVLKNNCRIVRMNKPDKYVNAIGFSSGTRVMVPASGFTSSNYVTTFQGNQIQLTTTKARGAVAITDDDKEDAAGQDWNEFILRMVAKKIANEIEEVAWISDTHDLSGFESDDLRSVFDGWRYRIMHSQSGEEYENDVTGSATILDAALGSGHTTDFNLAGAISVQDTEEPYAWEHKYLNMQKKMPAEYLQTALPDMRYWNHPRVTQDYVGALSHRATALGDMATMGVPKVAYQTVPVVSAPLMATTLDSDGVLGGGAYTDSFLTPAKNLIWGVQRALTLEKYRDAANERDIWFFSIRMCFEVENVNAVVLTKNITT